MSKIFVDACFRRSTPYTPVWMMRQAGRYLKEYMEVRSKAGNFLNLCHNPKLAAEVTIQPLDIVGVDAAILFSDILVIPNEMGMHLEFLQGEGPVFKEPIKTFPFLSIASLLSSTILFRVSVFTNSRIVSNCTSSGTIPNSVVMYSVKVIV